MYRTLADLVVLAHLAYILFAVLGGLLVVRRPRLAWVHVPALLWAVLNELAGWLCPLTPLEVGFRERAGAAAYKTGFVEHYLLPVIYPAELTRGLQVALGLGVLAINLAVYAWLIRRRLGPRAEPARPDGAGTDR